MDVGLADIHNLCVVLRQDFHHRGRESRSVLSRDSYQYLFFHYSIVIWPCPLRKSDGMRRSLYFLNLFVENHVEYAPQYTVEQQNDRDIQASSQQIVQYNIEDIQ